MKEEMIQVDKWFFKIGNVAVTSLENLKLEPTLPSDKDSPVELKQENFSGTEQPAKDLI